MTAQSAYPASNPVFDNLFSNRPDLDGGEGSNRASEHRCRISASNDHEAIQAWLSLRETGSHTHQSYRKEAERFLLWSVAERGKPLSSLDTVDCKAYRDFLAAPPAHWLNPTFRPRWSLDWRPLKGPLSRRNIKQAETILSSMCGWLVGQRYLDANPFDGLPALPTNHGISIQTDHALDEAQWQWLVGYCLRRQNSSLHERGIREYRRLWITLQLAYCTGLRIAELAAARFCDITIHNRSGGPQYWLKVLGKGGKLREVPLPSALADELKAYAKERGIVWGMTDTQEPIIGKFRKSLTSNPGRLEEFKETSFHPVALHSLLKQFFNEAVEARKAESDGDSEQDRREIESLGRMTAHWLRHTHATHALGRGAELIQIKDNLGHASLSTTSLYLHSDKDSRHAAMQGLVQKPIF
jgi:integrase